MDRPVVAVAGATGFVGEALRRALLERFSVVALTRSPTRAALGDASGVEWRHCDLFSKSDVEQALAGVDYALYLVHSMMPSARLTQASFVDLDLLLADNFARAAEINGVKQILYVGGIQPEGADVSRHLASRLEVESTLAARKTPVTALRAGLIVGPGGSSMRLMVQLVRRLPVLPMPPWADAESAPIAIEDVVRAVLRCLGEPDTYGGSFEIGGPERMSYRGLAERCAKVLGRRIWVVPVPALPSGPSYRVVSWLTGTPPALVGPLVESLRHSVLPHPNWLQDWLLDGATPFDEALRRSVGPSGRPLENPRRALRAGDDRRLKAGRTVRSVQRLPLPAGTRARWVAEEYARWLPQFMWPFLAVETRPGPVLRFRLRMIDWTLLELTQDPNASGPDRELFRITGGLLARADIQRGRFEFREVLGGKGLIAAIHDFRPSLPWFVYSVTQAVVHLVVMRGFGRHLARLPALGPGPQATPALEAGEEQAASRIDTPTDRGRASKQSAPSRRP